MVCEEPIDLRGLQLHAAEPGELGKTGFGHGSLDGSALLSGALCTAAGAVAAAAGVPAGPPLVHLVRGVVGVLAHLVQRVERRAAVLAAVLARQEGCV